MARKKIGLALSSGGTRGLVHVGVIKQLVKNEVPIDYIAGVSAGALIGGIFAATKDIEMIESFLKDLKYWDFVSIMADFTTKAGIIKGKKIMKLLEEKVGKKQVGEALIPFKSVATDIKTGEMIVMDQGDLALAIRASISVPFIFKPVEKDNKLLIDGGAVCPVPVKVVKNMGADRIIAVNLYDYASIARENMEALCSSPVKLFSCSTQLTLANLAKKTAKGADLILNPRLSTIPINLKNFAEIEKYIKIGEQMVLDNLGKIKDLVR